MRLIKYQKFELDAEFSCISLNVRDSPKCARISFGELRAIRTVGEVRQSMKIAKILMFKNSSKFEFSKFSILFSEYGFCQLVPPVSMILGP